VPHVNRAEDARRAVASVKYHPLGERGLAAATRPAGYGYAFTAAEYAAKVNAEMLVCVQIEHEEAVRNLDEVLRVEGVDVFFIGPSDLSQSMGYPGRTSAPEVQATIRRTFARIKAAGRISGSAGSAEAIRGYMAQGAQYLYTHVPKLLAAGTAQFMGAVKGGET